MPPPDVLTLAHHLASQFLAGIGNRHVGGRATQQQLRESLGGPLPIPGTDPERVIEELFTRADPGVVAQAGPRYFGFVTGGALPVTVAADWLASAWDQNVTLYVHSPAAATMEDVVAGWILELLHLPATASVGFTSGCHMANFTGLAAARHEVLRRAGWDVERQGLQQAPRVRVFVGKEVHVSAVGALRFLGFGAEELEAVPVDDQGCMRAVALREQMRGATGPLIVCAQVGNVATGASDPIADIVAIAHERGAWVHVDGAFGLWAAAVPELRDQVRGLEGADSWATDAHKWLNVPYDSGLVMVANPAAHRAAVSFKASYFQRGADEERAGMDWVPESSRRARVIPLYALIKTLGRDGIADMIRRNVALARRMADLLSGVPGIRVLNTVSLNQVLVQFDGTGNRTADAITRAVMSEVQKEGTCWAGGAVWQGQQVMRISISNWSTTEADIDRSAAAIAQCYGSVVQL
jgi:glutamate/tyrosine decarboxylase-like PLP-dependent enzyme